MFSKSEEKYDLIVEKGPDKGKIFSISQKAIVGRDAEADVDLADFQVSRRHMQIEIKKDKVFIKDLGSSNGTIINGRLVMESAVDFGEYITVGQTCLSIVKRGQEEDDFCGESTKRVILTTEETSPEQMTMIHYQQPKVDQTYEKGRLIKLLSLSNKIYAILDLEKIVNVLMDCIFDIFPSTEKVVLFLYDDQGKRVPYAYRVNDEESSQIKISQTILDKIHEKKSAILSSNVSGDTEYRFSESIILDKITSFMCAPMYIDEKPVGIFYVHTTKLEGCFSEDDLRFFLVICNQIAMSIYNAKLYSDLSNMAKYNASILTSITSGIIVIDNEGIIKTFNRTAEDIFHLDSNAVVGKTISEVQKLKAIEDAIKTTMDNQNSMGRIEISFFDEEEDQEKIIGLGTSILRDHTHSIRGIIAFFKDLTEIIKLNRLLQRSERLAALGEMAAGVAHEIRNPLNSIRGFAQLFHEGIVTQEKTKESSEIIIKEVDRLNSLVVDLLDFGKEQKITKTKVNFKDLVNDIIAYVKQGSKVDSVKWDTDFALENLDIEVDPDKIKQVLINLYQNALDAVCEKENAAIATTVGQAKDKHGMLLISVKDNGSGIPEKILKKVFNPFYSTKTRGSGLGLSICQRIIEEHGGQIDVISQKDAGTMFHIYLPAG